ncbi:MAG: hypothetical protein GMKNLPBB_03350 [Myxococcota bacterium]|nr:hypothetical protein [Myxococcota bacterium]
MKRWLLAAAVAFLALGLALAAAIFFTHPSSPDRFGHSPLRKALDVAWAKYDRRNISEKVKAPHGAAGSTRVVFIPRGTELKDLVRLLKEADLIGDDKALYAYLRHLRPELARFQAGEYELPRGKSALELMDILGDKAQQYQKKYRVTIREGLRIDEAAKEAAALELVQDKAAFAAAFERLARSPETARQLGVQADSLEGYLYPSTYEFRKPFPGAPEEAARAVIHTMVEQWRKLFTRDIEEKAKAMGLDRRQLMTLASIIEKESGVSSERGKIASVFHNRLKKGMKLQTDPTIIYSLLLAGKWDGDIRKEHFTFDHPYNTYMIKGLPPGPIASPSIDAIRAAAAPEKTPYLFFVAKGDASGEHNFCPDEECHMRMVEKYVAAQRKK